MHEEPIHDTTISPVKPTSGGRLRWLMGAGLGEVDRVRTRPGMADYPLLHATAGTFLERSGEPLVAAAHFERALACRISGPERRFLERKLAGCRAEAARRAAAERYNALRDAHEHLPG